jgi:hypothetical protein
MDIMRPPPDEQVAPAPWLVARDAAEVPALVRKAMTNHPKATVDEVVSQLAAWGAQVSGIIASMWMMEWNKRAEPTKPNNLTEQRAANTELLPDEDPERVVQKPTPSTL